MYDIESILDVLLKSNLLRLDTIQWIGSLYQGQGKRTLSDNPKLRFTQILHLLLFLLFPPAPFIMLRGKARERSGIQVTTKWE